MSGECDFLSANMYARSLFGKPTFSFRSSAQRLTLTRAQAKTHLPISVSSARMRVPLWDTSGFGVRRRASRFRWVIGLLCVSEFCLFKCHIASKDTSCRDDITAQKDSKPQI